MDRTLVFLTALLAGGAIGCGFGLLQHLASRRLARLQSQGRFTNGWAVMPGSFRRIALLLIAMAGVQLVCPRLFGGGIEWVVSAGVLLGYGSLLARQLIRRLRGADV